MASAGAAPWLGGGQLFGIPGGFPAGWQLFEEIEWLARPSNQGEGNVPGKTFDKIETILFFAILAWGAASIGVALYMEGCHAW